MSCKRMHIVDDIHLVTNRCFQERLFMLPNRKINFIIGYWFARALKKYGQGLNIYAFIFLSNHFHILLKDTTGTLARFMCYFEANVARAINREIGRKGTFWQGHYDDKIVVEEADFWSSYTYVICNAVKAGLVTTSSEWLGWSSYHNALNGGIYSFTAINRNRYNRASRNRKKDPGTKNFEETYKFSLSTPPGLEERNIEEQASHICVLVQEQERAFRKQREYKPPLGIEAIQRQNPTDRPVAPSRKPKRRFKCSNKEKLAERLEQFREFDFQYGEVLEQFKKTATKRRSFHNKWPVGSYIPGRWVPVGFTGT